MKTGIKITVLCLLLNAGLAMDAPKVSAQQFSISFQVFYDQLSPYGTWIYRPDFGYVWLPDVPAGFFPYASDGYWIYTDYGWTWVSLFPWGWAPFHYGRWYFDPDWGPMWVPGFEWSPAWVVWRSSGAYCGWAPLGPGMWPDAAWGDNYVVPVKYWRFVTYREFGRPDMDRHYVNLSDNITIINHTRIINNVRVSDDGQRRYFTGPALKEAEEHSGRNFSRVEVRNTDRPGERVERQQLEIYRPKVERQDPGVHSPAPSRSVRWEDLNSQSEKKTINPLQDRKINPSEGNGRPYAKPSNPSKSNPAQQPRSTKPQHDEPVPVKKQHSSRRYTFSS